MAATLEQTYESDAPSLATVVKLKGADVAALYVLKEFTEYLAFTMVKERPTENQLRMIVTFILEDHSALTLDDIRLFFRNCCKGKYGNNYNRIDGPTIMQWLAAFEKELDEYLDYRRSIEDERRKNEIPDVVKELAEQCPENIQKKLNKLTHGIACTDAELKVKQEEKRKADQIRSSVVRSMLHLYNTQPAAEVDKLIDDEVKTQLINNNLFEYL